MKLAVIVPMLNEERAIATTLRALRIGAPVAEIIVADGGSNDDSVAIARTLADTVITAPRGRARQMNAGAAAARGDVLAFVHADTLVPTDFAGQIAAALDDPAIVGGRFDVRLNAASPSYRLLSTLINWRSRVMRSATGDQAIFVRREVFERLGGYPDIKICEDVALVRRLRRAGRLACLRARVTTSARRWQSRGLIRTVLTMWTIKSLFLLGVSPAWLKRHYFDAR
ncbi:MAG TPA: TIGR04283 family arsenosugar biosynthesis glycosyltransferase [Candidatus Binataceae bacterium]|nr:TIGR04283 family arsenosugar biosynthesis glycosyltransferase [Candidatus Binataceae bacterium]